MEEKTLNEICIVVVGPTASGKSALAIELCRQFNLEIVNADAIQLYKGLPISTAMVQGDEMGNIPHHCLGVIPPESYVTVTTYQKYAHDIIDCINHRSGSNGVCIVGGTTYYIESLLFKDGIGKYSSNGSSSSSKDTASHTTDNYDLLCSVDPQVAQYIHPNDNRKIRRALQIYANKSRGRDSDNHSSHSNTAGDMNEENGDACQTTMHFSNPIVVDIHVSQNEEADSDIDTDCAASALESQMESNVHIDNSMNVLETRIHRRVDKMIENGLITEISHFYSEEYTPLIRSVLEHLQRPMPQDLPLKKSKLMIHSSVEWTPCSLSNEDLLSVRNGILEKLKLLGNINKGCNSRKRACMNTTTTGHESSNNLLTIKGLVTEYGIFQNIGFKEFIDYLDYCHASGSISGTVSGIKDSDQCSSWNTNTTSFIDRCNDDTAIQFKNESIHRLKIHTVRYAKKQLKWIRNKFIPQCQAHNIPIISVNACDIPLSRSKITGTDSSCPGHIQSLEELFDQVRSYLETTTNNIDNSFKKRSAAEIIEGKVNHMMKKRLLYHCDICENRAFQGLNQFNIHLSSRVHKNAKKSKRKKEKYQQYMTSNSNENRGEVMSIPAVNIDMTSNSNENRGEVMSIPAVNIDMTSNSNENRGEVMSIPAVNIDMTGS